MSTDKGGKERNREKKNTRSRKIEDERKRHKERALTEEE